MVETSRVVRFEVDGRQVEVPDDGADLLTVLRERLRITSPKDGCSPQGQCGCCTVLVDGQPRVACVTPARRVRGRSITTLDGLDPARRQAWADAFCDTGASQCGFCTPGIVLRLEGLDAKAGDLADEAQVQQALLAHLCRCTGWRTILDAAARLGRPTPVATPARDLEAAAQRAAIEGRGPQRVGPHVPLGGGGFADDTAPADALVAVPDAAGGWAVGETLAEARAASGKIQGRRTTVEISHPIDPPAGDWAAVLQTTWVEPAYLEIDASWSTPDGTPASPLANGGAFGGKRDAEVCAVARELADRHGRPVRVVLSREDAVRRGPKRPPLAAAVRPDGSGVVRVARTAGIAEAVASVAPRLRVEEVDVPGPPTSAALRGAGWAEALVALAGAAASRAEPPGAAGAEAGPALLQAQRRGQMAGAAARSRAEPLSAAGAEPGLLRAQRRGERAGEVSLRSPDGARATAHVTLGEGARIEVRIACGRPLDEVVLRSYCIGAAHMALSWACSEALAVDREGAVHDLTIRSFGVLRAVDTPPIEVAIEPDDRPPVNGSDAVFAAVAAATWLAQGCPQRWPLPVDSRQGTPR